jgi:hypothetical protein
MKNPKVLRLSPASSSGGCLANLLCCGVEKIPNKNNNRDCELTKRAANKGTFLARIFLVLLISCHAGLVFSQDVVALEPWGDRVDKLIDDISDFQKTSKDADELYVALERVLHDRIHKINARMRSAYSPTEPVNQDNEFPTEIVTIADLHANVGDLYSARLRLLDHLTSEMRLEVTATDVIGVGQLKMEIEFIWEQVRFRALNLPAAIDNLWRRVQIAPLPVVWHLIRFLIFIAVFRWWRKWLPETLGRMQLSLADIRPRSAAVMRRIRLIWYIEQLRRPLEWMLFFTVVLAMVNLEGLNLLTSIIESVVIWILLAWFSVSILNAFSTRGAAGIAGVDASIRLKSLRLVAAWLVLLGLGLNLADELAGVATLHAWVWRLFQVLALPVLLVLLAWWRKPIFARLERESETSDAVKAMLRHQRGLRSFGSAANGALWLIANGMRRSLTRAFLRVGDGQSLPFGSASSSTSADVAVDTRAGISSELRISILRGESGYEKHARSDRRKIVRRGNAKQSGVVAVVGERGIGKNAFLSDVASTMADRALIIESNKGLYAELEHALCQALAVEKPSAKNISDALRSQDIRLVAVKSVHRLSRPVPDGQAELKRFADLIEAIDHELLWVLSVDCFTWQFIRRMRADRASIHETIDLPAWTEDQIAALIEQRNASAGIAPDFSSVQVPSEHAVTSYDTAVERNKAGVYRMLWSISGGNPAVALLTWANCLYHEEEGSDTLCVRLPVQPAAHELENSDHNVMLVLRCIAQSELVLEEDVIDNLRLPPGAVSSAMRYCISKGWIEEHRGYYRLTMGWFKPVTRTLARQNLLAR